MVSFVQLVKEKATCCICTKPLHDSKYLSMAQIDKKAAWKVPVWNNVLIQGLEDRAVGIVCDGCHEAAEKSGVAAKVKYAIEIRGDDIILHDVEQLEDVEPIQDIIAFKDPEKIPDIPDFFTGSINDRKKIDDKLFECCPGSKKDQRNGFFCGLN